MADVVISASGTEDAPFEYPIPNAAELLIKAITASFDGGGAGAFVPAIQLIVAGDVVAATMPLGSTVAAGGSVDVSWFPRGGGVAEQINPLTPVASTLFTPAGGFIQIVSTDGTNPTNLATTSSFEADGVTTYLISFYVSTIDISVQVGGTGAASLLTLSRDGTVLGNISDFNIVPDTGNYGSVPVYATVLDTPPAGSHTYSVGGYYEVSGGTVMTTNAYGTGLLSPETTLPGYLSVTAVN